MLNNKRAVSISLITLLVTSAAILISAQTTTARYPGANFTTYCYVFPGQPVVGVGQTILIEMYLNAYPTTATGEMGDRWTFYLTITKPSGVNETKGPIISDPVGGAYIAYVPDEVGVYTIQASFPGKTLTGAPGNENNQYVNDTYAPSISRPNTFTVQQEPIPNYQETPLPNDYWTRPINDANRGWGNAVMGQWLGGTYYESILRNRGVPNQSGPLSSHILWTRSYWTGGIMGGYGDIGYYNGIAYEGFSSPLITLEGKAYYQVQNPPRYGWFCIDLYNGETIYYENNTLGDAAIPSLAQILNYDSPNQHGGFSYLWRTSGVTLPSGTTTASGLATWEMLDGFTGKSICKIANVSTSGTQFRDSIGSICYINIVNLGTTAAPNYYMQIWNSTQAIWWRPNYGIAYPATLINGTTDVPNRATGDNAYWFWRPGATTVSMSTSANGAIYNGYNGYTMNISVASLYGPRNSVLNETATIRDIVPDEYVLVGTAGRNDARGNAPGFMRAYSLKPGQWGTPILDVTFNAPLASDNYPVNNGTNGGGVSLGGVSYQNNVFWYTERVTGKIWVYDLKTGNQLWTYQLDNQFAFQGMSVTAHDGKVFTLGSMGEMHCFDARTGESLWNWTAPLQGNLETQGLTYTPLSLCFFIDDAVTGRNLVYLHGSTGWAGETSPIRRDGAIFCLDIDTGELIWRLMAYPNTANNALSKVIISDSRILFLDNHDNQIYCIGRGPSATTVSAPQTAPVLGTSVTITGTVTDQSPSGRHDINGNLDKPLKGTPAISDKDMDAWMEYMFHQRPMPTNAKGVDVELHAIDPNGNWIPMGNATSDVYGNYGISFKPEVPGLYQIIAEFKGSNAYGPSSSSTYLTVEEAPQSTTAPTEQPQTVADMYLIPGIISIIIAIAIVGAILALLLLRKRP
ncbi:MAG: PQQ-binding-like beta-propeller repeat protein [Candidatus Bathyarchaeota archaeon]|nr:PQQ-binding-like beta-propeller repeat protein [Candidatus Bathyarchaeota archaeon]